MPIESQQPPQKFIVTDERTLKHPYCDRCGQPMWLIRIRTDAIGSQVRLFECLGCGEETSVSVSKSSF